MRVKPHHPLMELLGQLLFGIENVPCKEQRLMRNCACREAVKWHKNEVSRMKDWVKDMERDLVAINGLCPECYLKLGKYTHKRDCDLAILLGLFEE